MTYSLEEIDAKLADAQARFDGAKRKKDEAEEAVKENDAEMFRLQGEHRVLTHMRNLAMQAEQAAPVEDKALTIEAKPKKDEK